MRKGAKAYIRVRVVEVNELGECYVTAVNQDGTPRQPAGVFKVQGRWMVSGESIIRSVEQHIRSKMRRGT